MRGVDKLPIRGIQVPRDVDDIGSWTLIAETTAPLPSSEYQGMLVDGGGGPDWLSFLLPPDRGPHRSMQPQGEKNGLVLVANS